MIFRVRRQEPGENGAEIQYRRWWWPFWSHYSDCYSLRQADDEVKRLMRIKGNQR